MLVLSPNAKWMAWNDSSKRVCVCPVVSHPGREKTEFPVSHSCLLAVSDRGSVAIWQEDKGERLLVSVEQKLRSYDVTVPWAGTACFLPETADCQGVNKWDKIVKTLHLENGDVLCIAPGRGELFVHPPLAYLCLMSNLYPTHLYYKGREYEIREGMKIGGVWGDDVVAAIGHDIVLFSTPLICLTIATLPDMIAKIRLSGEHLGILCAQGDVFYMSLAGRKKARKIASGVMNIGWQGSTLVCVHYRPSQKEPHPTFYSIGTGGRGETNYLRTI